MYPEVNKTLTGIHDFQKWLQASDLRPQALCPTALGSQVPFHPSSHLKLESKHVLGLVSPRLT